MISESVLAFFYIYWKCAKTVVQAAHPCMLHILKVVAEAVLDLQTPGYRGYNGFSWLIATIQDY